MGRRSLDTLASKTSEMLVNEFELMYKSVKSANRKPHLLLREFQNRIHAEMKILRKSRERREIRFRRAKSTIPGYVDLFNRALREVLVSSSIPASAREKAEASLPDSAAVFNEVLLDAAREVWKQPNLFYHATDDQARAKNTAKVTLIIRDVVEDAVVGSVPDIDYSDESDEEISEILGAKEVEEPEPEPESASESDIKSESEPEPEPESASESDIKSEPEPEPESASESETESETDSESESDTESETQSGEAEQAAASVGEEGPVDLAEEESEVAIEAEDEEEEEAEEEAQEPEEFRPDPPVDPMRNEPVFPKSMAPVVHKVSDWIDHPEFPAPPSEFGDDGISVANVDEYAVPQFRVIDIDGGRAESAGKKSAIVDKIP